MNKLNTNIIIGSIVIAGAVSFIYAQFILSTALFGIAAIYSNIVKKVNLNS
jgi:hypothetical protein